MKNIKILRILTILLSISLALVSVAGAFFPATYARDSASLGAQGVGQDLVDLFVAVPLLLISFFYTAKGNRAAVLVYGGTLFYILYSFIIYCFGIHFNRFFLLYCLTLSLSLYSFILLFSELRQQKVDEWFKPAPVKIISVYIIIVALIFYTLWLRSIVPSIIYNKVPKDVSDYHLLVNPVHVIDLVFALPGLLIGAILLWRNLAIGYIIASIALVFMVLLTLALAAMVMVLLARGISEDFTVAILFGGVAATTIVFSLLLLRKLKSNRSI